MKDSRHILELFAADTAREEYYASVLEHNQTLIDAGETLNFLDSIESPPIIFLTCVCLGCLLGYLNYRRQEQRLRVNRLPKQNPENNV